MLIRTIRSKRNTTNVLAIMFIYRCEQRILLALILCLSLAHLIAADQDRCLFHTNCAQCLAVDGCGWCDGYCLSGSKTGPNGDTVACPIWQYGTNATCEAPGVGCTKFSDCYACTKQSGCGWCKMGGVSSCVGGSVDGPGTGQCSTWTWSDDLCNSVLQCAEHTTCRECLQDNSLMCGWCDTTNKCTRVTGSQKQRAIDLGQNLASTSECPKLKLATCEDTCYEMGVDCQACLLQKNCGWCPSLSSCLKGSAEGPTYLNNTDTCHAIDWKQVTCTEQPKCEQLSGCTDCLAQQGCYWCANIGCSSQNSDQCCSTCSPCRFNRVQHPLFIRVSIILLTACATAMAILLLTAIVYSFYYYYWSRRHYFEVLE